jgi:hypothetical protein
MRITHLDADVLSEIFLLNDVYTILSLSRVRPSLAASFSREEC